MRRLMMHRVLTICIQVNCDRLWSVEFPCTCNAFIIIANCHLFWIYRHPHTGLGLVRLQLLAQACGRNDHDDRLGKLKHLMSAMVKQQNYKHACSYMCNAIARMHHAHNAWYSWYWMRDIESSHDQISLWIWINRCMIWSSDSAAGEIVKLWEYQCQEEYTSYLAIFSTAAAHLVPTLLQWIYCNTFIIIAR